MPPEIQNAVNLLTLESVNVTLDRLTFVFIHVIIMKWLFIFIFCRGKVSHHFYFFSIHDHLFVRFVLVGFNWRKVVIVLFVYECNCSITFMHLQILELLISIIFSTEGSIPNLFHCFLKIATEICFSDHIWPFHNFFFLSLSLICSL